MIEKLFRLKAFTLIETMVVLLIVAILALVGVGQLSKMRAARLESSAEKLAALLSTARSSSVGLGCPTRIVVCQNLNCEGIDSQTVTAQGSSSPLGLFLGSSGNAALFVGLIRQMAPCNMGTNVAGDGLANWDFHKKPIAIANDLVLSPIYNTASGVISYANADAAVGTTLERADVAGSFWFDPDLTYQVPVDDGLTATGATVAFQIQYNTCNPATDEDCYGMFVVLAPDGQVSTLPCLRGTRANNSNICFNP